ncbi:NifU-like N terminal domain-containing protein [Aspergillus alliaceus]|uniref:Iron-sulfur cluster assembly protein n=1 Tax=Petromyces alliaceus TaxID=209559 RepID=A0A5N6GBT4_PETAA|nr:NifU-like N terminal domain-containing protein [Aspergillus alliaceus]KAB8239862.1 NifU-like N terminal domain-containing protein [Aspergillus alliaceus]KAE8390606.1 NifU-like N terminal domain-containing protein [Aspergillus alliaceus]
MFRRLVTVAPRVGTVVSPRITPALAGIQTQPLLRVPATKRGYHEKDKYLFMDHYNNPRNVGSFNKNDADVATGLVGAPACGDVMKLQIRVDKDTNVISDVRFKTFGCGSAIASSSYLTELVRGMTLEEAGKIKNTEIARELLPPVKLHCSMLAEDAIKSAIANYYTKNPNTRQTDLGGTGASIPNVKVEVEKTQGAGATA